VDKLREGASFDGEGVWGGIKTRLDRFGRRLLLCQFATTSAQHLTASTEASLQANFPAAFLTTA